MRLTTESAHTETDPALVGQPGFHLLRPDWEQRRKPRRLAPGGGGGGGDRGGGGMWVEGGGRRGRWVTSV